MAFNCGVDAIEAGDNLGGGAFPFNCDCWGSECCGERRRRRLVAELASGKPNRFITITCREGQFETPEIGSERLSWAWKIIVQRWRRLHPGKKCEYGVVREAQENGWPHLHIAWHGPWISREWLSQQTAELLNSPQTAVKLVRGIGKVARYIAKYVGKKPHQFGTSKRYWFSEHYRPKDWKDRRSIFDKRLKFRQPVRTMHQVRRWLENEFIEFTEHRGGALTWEFENKPPRPPPRTEPRRLRFVRGSPKFVSKAGITPVELADGHRS